MLRRMYIGIISRYTPELHSAFQRLVPQLGAHKVPPELDEIVKLIDSENSTLLVGRDPDENGQIVGMLCLSVYRVPTGVRSIIEDVVVDERMRQRGVGEALVRRAIELAREAGADGISLTSNPKREAANRLYQSIGFEIRKTNAYYYKLK